jgi:hypothetical protein
MTEKHAAGCGHPESGNSRPPTGTPETVSTLYIQRIRAYVARHLNSITRSRRGTADPAEGDTFPDRPMAGTPKDMT